jgi:crotonobetainyl-CoA:carnitine CoA-transferase CaiB-like acyl-CoA transferase
MATVLAAPIGATLCADHGAEVVKLELPDGSDALRGLQPVKEGVPLWWKVANRGKLGITLDVRKPKGREIFLSMIAGFDVLVENFRTGTLDKWGLDIETLRQANPRLIVVRLTGFGQTGPYRHRPGFARIFEAMSGFTNLTGEEGGPPLHSNYPVGDYVAGLFCAFSIAMEIARLRSHPDVTGREVDLSATEAIFRLLDPLAVEFEQMQFVRGPAGNRASYTAPSNVYRSKDGVYFSLVASSNAIFERLCKAIGRPEWIADPRFQTNPARVKNLQPLDSELSAWFGAHAFEAIVSLLETAEVPFSKAFSIEDILKDPHFQERGTVVRMEDPDYGSVPGPCVVPRIAGEASPVPRSGPALGEHNATVYGGLGIDAQTLAMLRSEKIV